MKKMCPRNYVETFASKGIKMSESISTNLIQYTGCFKTWAQLTLDQFVFGITIK